MFSEHQYGFIPGASRVAELLSTTKVICKSLDINPSDDKRETFFDISKAFDKVRHKALKFYGVDGRLLILMENYLTGC